MIQNSLLNKRLPPFSGLLLVALLFGTISWLTGNVVLLGTKAATGGVPKQVTITNITDNSFTVTYTTDEPASGSVAYGTSDTLGNVALDDQDQPLGKTGEHQVHHITITNVTPATKYVFEISSEGEVYKNGDSLYETTTATPLDKQTGTGYSVSGQVTLADGTLPKEAIVEVTSDTSQQLSTLVKQDGSYQIQLDSLRSNDLTQWASISADTKLHITASNGIDQATADVLAGQANPAPPITLSQHYDFSLNDSTASSSADTTASNSGTLPVPEDTSSVSSPTITTPTSEQGFDDQKPQFEGKALPNKNVVITIHSDQAINTTVQSDANGNWNFTPTVALSPGAHTITIKSVDVNGILQTITQSFVVHASGSQFIEPSVSPVLPTATPLPTAAPTATPAPTAMPTATPIPTIQPTTIISVIPTQVVQPAIPKTGNSSPVIIALIGVLATAGAGTLLFFIL